MPCVTNPGGNYALARERTSDAGSITNFAPIPNFTGVFDGQGQTISNLTIAPNNSTTHDVGLFGVIGAAGVVRDLNLANVNVTANPGVTFQTVGTLAGTNLGTVSGVTATGTVNGGTATDAVLGGLVGANGNFGFLGSGPGSITNSHADVTVSSASVNVALGGLVGVNAPGSTIIGSSASGDVIATATVNKGGPDCGFSNLVPARVRRRPGRRELRHDRLFGCDRGRLRRPATAPRAGSSVSTAASSPMRSRPAMSPARPAPAASTAKAAAPRSAALPASIRV